MFWMRLNGLRRHLTTTTTGHFTVLERPEVDFLQRSMQHTVSCPHTGTLECIGKSEIPRISPTVNNMRNLIWSFGGHFQDILHTMMR